VERFSQGHVKAAFVSQWAVLKSNWAKALLRVRHALLLSRVFISFSAEVSSLKKKTNANILMSNKKLRNSAPRDFNTVCSLLQCQDIMNGK